MFANSPIDRVIGVGWDLSPHAFSFNLLTALEKNCKVYLILVEMSPEIIPADLLDSLSIFCFSVLARLFCSCAVCFCCVRFSFFTTTGEERLQNDLFCVGWDVKP